MNKYFIILIFFFSCSHSYNSEKTDAEADLVDIACEICLIKDKLNQLQKDKILAKTNPELDINVDSLNSVREDLQVTYDLKLDKFKTDGNYKSIFFAKDTAKAICMQSILFGNHLTSTRRGEIFDQLANEILAMKSGFTISSKRIIEMATPQTNENGDLYVFDKLDRSKKIITDFEAWRAEELKEFDAWMNDIDKLLIELHGKNYDEFTEIEKIVLDYHLRAALNEKNR